MAIFASGSKREIQKFDWSWAVWNLPFRTVDSRNFNQQNKNLSVMEQDRQ